MNATELETKFIAEATRVADMLKTGSPIEQTVKKVVATRISGAVSLIAQYLGSQIADDMLQALIDQYRTAIQLEAAVTDPAERKTLYNRLDAALEAVLPGDVKTAAQLQRAGTSDYAGLQSDIDSEAALKGWNPPAGKAN